MNPINLGLDRVSTGLDKYENAIGRAEKAAPPSDGLFAGVPAPKQEPTRKLDIAA